MRKAFDENVPRTKPRLKLSSLFPQPDALDGNSAPAGVAPGGLVSEASIVPSPSGVSLESSAPVAVQPTEEPRPVLPVEKKLESENRESPKLVQQPVRPSSRPIAAVKVAPTPPVPPRDPVADAQARRRKLKERLKAATQPVSLAEPTPPTAIAARASALSLVGQLQAELEKSNALNKALVADLDAARGELARAIEEAKSRSAESERMAAEVGERAKLIEELGAELAGLEGERDDTLGQLQAARAEARKLSEERKALQDELLRRERELEDAVSEEERLATELEARTDDLRKARTMVATLSNERTTLIEQVSRLSKEKEDLTDAQKALSEIHRALAEARVRTAAPGSQLR
jgi:DNA repair exonuclease SbcCD ATPase subunit